MYFDENFENFYESIKFKKILYIFFSLVIIIILGLIIKTVILTSPSNRNSRLNNLEAKSTSTFPGDLSPDYYDKYNNWLVNIDASKILFGDKYTKDIDNFQPVQFNYSLPMDVKVDVDNFYDVARHIDLIPYIDDLNKNGFAIMDNKDSKKADNFYSIYQLLNEKKVPLFISTDFLLYHYQNELKLTYKEIERSAFYRNLWDTLTELYKISSKRYLEKKRKLGVANDPILEGSRLETAYIAVALALLTPSEKQLETRASLSGGKKFDKQEAVYFDFVIPDYLRVDVAKEIGLIRSAKEINRSPVLLYNRDYEYFRIPRNYQDDPKLYNFYLANRWLNSVFPLYYRTDDCPDCLLDKNDWIINMTGASFLAKDLYENQRLKNKWAIIYKFIGWFTGLRQDLTYLNYYDALEHFYGKDFQVENIFARDELVGIDIAKLQDKLIHYSFSDVEGRFDRAHGENPQIGMRLLQMPYWPNGYVLGKLSGPSLTIKSIPPKKSKDVTSCIGSGLKLAPGTNHKQRCNGFGMDIVNLFYPIKDNSYFGLNTSYYNYDTKVKELKNIFGNFDVHTWNTNIYWATLDSINKMMNFDRSRYPIYMQSENWIQKKDVNSALGGWVNLHLPDDYVVSSYNENKSNTLESYSGCDNYNYIEPNIELTREFIAKNNMLLKMLDILHVAEQTNQANIKLRDLNRQLEEVLSIQKKILTNRLLDYGDCSFIEGLAVKHKIELAGDKYFILKLGPRKLREQIDDFKLIAVVYQNDDRRIMAVGPIFNYHESKQ